MKALSVKQPWASLIVDGTKTIELRTWRTKFRGEFVLCSSASRPPVWLRKAYPESSEGPRGLALAVVELVSVSGVDPYDQWTQDAACCTPGWNDYAWHVRLVRRFKKPIPVKGRLGWWDFDDALLRRAR